MAQLYKRGASNQITKDDFDEDDRRDEEIDPVKKADASTMAKRKILPLPKKRGAAGGSSNASNGAGGNVFGSFGGASSGGAAAPKPMSFGSSNGGADTTSDANLKRIALNEKFAESITTQINANPSVDLTEAVNKYVQYAQALGGVSTSSSAPAPAAPNFGAAAAAPAFKPAAPAPAPAPAPAAAPAAASASEPAAPKSLFSFGDSKNFSASKPAEKTEEPAAPKPFTFGSKSASDDAPKPFTFGSKPAAAAPAASPAFSFGNAAPAASSGPSFSFNKTEEKPKPKPVPVESDSDSDDDKIDVTQGPSFTLDTKPTTTDSPFSFSSKPSEAKAAGPSFTFDKKVSSGPFKFDSPKSETTKVTFNTPSGEAVKDHTWQPSQGIVFGSAPKSEDKEEEKKDKPAFSFGSASSSSSAAPSFSFGSKEADKSESKPGFSFGSASTDKPAFSFGSKAASTAPNPFSFGSSAPAAAAAPAAAPAFGVASGNLFKKDETKTETAEAGEPDDTPKTVTDSEDLSGQGPGEENEDNVAEYRVKLHKLADGKWETIGVGQLRVLVDKDTKKARILMRAEQSGRVVLNCVVRKELTYSALKNNVNIVDFDENSKPVKYLAKIKTAAEADKLSGKIEEVK